MADDEVTPLSTLTTNYGWVKPAVGGDVDVWGGISNTDLDGIDTTVKSVSNSHSDANHRSDQCAAGGDERQPHHQRRHADRPAQQRRERDGDQCAIRLIGGVLRQLWRAKEHGSAAAVCSWAYLGFLIICSSHRRRRIRAVAGDYFNFPSNRSRHGQRLRLGNGERATGDFIVLGSFELRPEHSAAQFRITPARDPIRLLIQFRLRVLDEDRRHYSWRHAEHG